MKKDTHNNDLQKELEELEAEFNAYKKETVDFIDSSVYLLNTYYLDYELNQPKFLLGHLQLMSIEVLNFVKNVCEKHDIEWWLDFGNLLGAFRHGKFIPWDEDMDIGMMREDYGRFENVISHEVKDKGLDDLIEVKKRPFKSGIRKFIQVLARGEVEIANFKYILGNVDIFPYDYIREYDENTLEEKYRAAKDKCMDLQKRNFIANYALDTFYEDMDLSWEPTDYIIPGWENPCTPGSMYKLVVYEREKIFPLNEIEFAGNSYPCPNEVDYYLDKLYPNYMKIPKNLRKHNRIGHFRHNKNNEEVFTNCYNRLREINAHFD